MVSCSFLAVSGHIGIENLSVVADVVGRQETHA